MTEKTTLHKITPFLWFEDKALEAARFYVSLFEGSRILDEHDGEDSGEPMSVSFELAGLKMIAFNGGPYFKFTPAVSLFVDCEDQGEVNRLWDTLTEGGEPGQCGWLIDRYGLSWQIVPTVLPSLLGHPDPVKAKRVMDAMLTMSKRNIAELEKASC